MSIVTNTILSFSIMEDEEKMVRYVNEYFEKEGTGHQRGFPLPSARECLEDDFIGGGKCLERPTHLAAFNYLREAAFLEHIAALPWECPDFVQVLLCRQEDEEYEVVFPCRFPLEQKGGNR